MILRLILFIVLFYFLIKAVKFIIKYLSRTKDYENIHGTKKDNGSYGGSKYKNIEEAKYTEIKPEDESTKD